MSGAECLQEIGLAGLVHFAFYHHDVVVGSTYHQLHVGILELLECRINYKLTVYVLRALLPIGPLKGMSLTAIAADAARPARQSVRLRRRLSMG